MLLHSSHTLQMDALIINYNFDNKFLGLSIILALNWTSNNAYTWLYVWRTILDIFFSWRKSEHPRKKEKKNRLTSDYVEWQQKSEWLLTLGV
jgi:hypothetical protein